MEVKINEFSVPAPITFNYDELKAWVQEKSDEYACVVYSDDMKMAKKDRADLNRVKKALNDERIRLQKEFMKPFEDYKSKTDELISILDNPISLIDKQIKDFDEQEKKEKRKEIELHYRTMDKPEWLQMEQIWNPKWLNKTVNMDYIRTEMKQRIEQIKNDLATLAELPEFGFEASKVYESTLDLNRALNEGRRLAEIQKQKEEAERRRKEQEEARRIAEEQRKEVPQPSEPVKLPAEEQPEVYPVRFEALLTAGQGKELAEWFNKKNIKFKPIEIFSKEEQDNVSEVYQNYYCAGIQEIVEEDETAKNIFQKIGLI